MMGTLHYAMLDSNIQTIDLLKYGNSFQKAVSYDYAKYCWLIDARFKQSS